MNTGVNLLGELLRNAFFDQTDGTGCYESFTLRPDVKKLGNFPVAYDPEFYWTHAERMYLSTLVTMLYYWDGDGVLVFILPNAVLLNTSCKKDYNWRSLTLEDWELWLSGI